MTCRRVGGLLYGPGCSCCGVVFTLSENVKVTSKKNVLFRSGRWKLDHMESIHHSNCRTAIDMR